MTETVHITKEIHTYGTYHLTVNHISLFTHNFMKLIIHENLVLVNI